MPDEVPAPRNRFREMLERGTFVVLGEVNAQGRDYDRNVVAERIAAFEQAALAASGMPTVLAVTEGGGSAEFHRAVEFADALAPENRDLHLFFLSGRGCHEDLAEALADAGRDSGILNWAAAGGSAVPGETARQLAGRHFMESTGILRVWRDRAERQRLFCGAVANPFQYTADALGAQHVKLMRKLRCGAQFVIAQSNWDMLKLQALRWYLNGRGCFVPTLARLMFLTPERVERILAGRFPGIVISPEFHAILNKELRFSRSQFEAAQWRRIELQAAGCRLLGYSGVQIAGLDKPEQLTLASEKIAGAMREFPAFDGWLDAYHSYQARAEMAPFSGSFYLYDRGLNRMEPDSYPPEMRMPDPPETTSGERFRAALARFCFPHADRQPASSRRLLKRLIAGCPGRCTGCTLPQTMYVCPRQCPKRLNGICGGVRPDGTCEVAGVGECVHVKIMRLARFYGREGELEDFNP